MDDEMEKGRRITNRDFSAHEKEEKGGRDIHYTLC